MYEYHILNKKTQEQEVIFGRTLRQACEKARLDLTEWVLIDRVYAD